MTYSFMPLRQHLLNLIRWRRKKNTSELIPDYSINKPIAPVEVLMEIISYLHNDRSTLYRLSLVSRETRLIVQPLLFRNVNDIKTMSSRAYVRFLRCRRKPYRHVLLYVRSFTIDFPLRSRPFLNNRDLLLSMSKVTHLTIHLHRRNKGLQSILQYCSEAFRLEDLTVTCEKDFAADMEILTNFISEQEQVKRLTVGAYSGVCLDFQPGALAQLETLCANWVQICNILPDRPLIKTVVIIDDPYILNVYVGPAMKRRLSYLLSVSVDIKIWMTSHLGDYLQDLEILELTTFYLTYMDCQIVGLWRRLFPLERLKVLILKFSGMDGERNDQRIPVDLFLKFPSLEKVVLREVGGEYCIFRRRVSEVNHLGVKA